MVHANWYEIEDDVTTQLQSVRVGLTEVANAFTIDDLTTNMYLDLLFTQVTLAQNVRETYMTTAEATMAETVSRDMWHDLTVSQITSPHPHFVTVDVQEMVDHIGPTEDLVAALLPVVLCFIETLDEMDSDTFALNKEIREQLR